MIRDRTRTHNGAETRTLTIDLPAPWLLHALFRSEAYASHTAGNVLVSMALATGVGYANATIGPTDEADLDDRTFEDYFSGGPDRIADKAAITFRPDVHDVEVVVPAVLEAVESVRPTYQDMTGESA